MTLPLTFSFASRAYYQVYVQFCEVMGVPKDLIDERETMFRNMLGLVRGEFITISLTGIAWSDASRF